MISVKMKYLLLIIFLVLTNCSGGLPLFSDMHNGRADKLQRIEVTPGNVSLTDTSFAMMTATGFYNDGSTVDVTAKCEWNCDDQTVAVISSGGYLQARKLSGSANVSARYDTLTSMVKISINIKLVQISIKPENTALKSSNQIYFTATGITSDGALLDMTKTVSWNVLPFSLADIDASGLFVANGTSGTVSVTALSPDGTIVSNAAKVQLDLTALYVDASFTLSAGDGTKEKPFPTINKALTRAEAIGATRIYVAKGIYTEDLVISKDISLFGGYISDYSESEWTREEIVNPDDTKICAKGNIAIIYTDGLSSGTVLDGFHIEGGNSILFSASIGVMCSNASPTIWNNKIYGGKSSITSIGILNQSASPLIRNNPVISGGLPDYTGGGSDNIAILCQSFSCPVIEGNGSSVSPSQIITGPSGGENTYRIKCESSSSATILNNTIETTDVLVTSARGILAIGSSPVIQANIITSALTDNIVIRGDNTSFKVVDNSIGGSVYITSGSMNPVLDNNKIIKGNITVTGSTVGASIRNHVVTDPADPDYKAHYGKSSRKILEGGVYYSGASGIIENNSLTFVVIMNNANVGIYNNIILSEISQCPIAVYSGSISEILRNIIMTNTSTSGNVYAFDCNDCGETRICNNNIYVYNSNVSNAGALIAIHAREISKWFLVANNNLFVDTASTESHIHGIYLGEINGQAVRIYNNGIMLNGCNYRSGIYFVQDTQPFAIIANYFINCTYDVSGAVIYSTKSELNKDSISPLMWALNEDIVSFGNTPIWKDYNLTRKGSSFIDNNLNIPSYSDFNQKGFNPRDYMFSVDATSISPDIVGTERIVETKKFSIGAYEFVP